MQNGLYRIEFGVGGNVGTGVITYRDGLVTGGDTGFAYMGRFDQDGDKLSGHVEVFQHAPGHPNVFAGLTEFTLTVQGTQMTDTTAGFHGSTPDAPDQGIKVSMQMLRPL